MHDGTFLYDHKDEIKEKFPGGVFIGDNHFLRGKKLIFKNDNIIFHTNYAKRDQLQEE